MKKYNQKDVRWLACVVENDKKAMVVPYIALDDTKIVDLLSNKVYSNNVVKNAVLVKRHFNVNSNKVSMKDWSTEEMITTYYCVLKKLSESYASKFLGKNEELDEQQIQSLAQKLEKELVKLNKAKNNRENKKSHNVDFER